jgi:phenylpropionate dioxygenase-like ring-hydroxylating dioxygenase large terminal subunit
MSVLGKRREDASVFLRNCWYVAAWREEVTRIPLARILLSLPVMLYRTEKGEAVALEDRCCHRNLPLSMGFIEGDNVRCGYHGLKFAPSGQCIEIPGQPQIPPDARVTRYPLIERWGLLWIWMGDPEQVDESLLPQWHYLAEPGWAVIKGNDTKPMPMKCNWELNNDNLLDLSHVAHVHPKTLGGHGTDTNPVITERLERSVRMSRWMPNLDPIPLWTTYIGDMGKVDRWQITEAELPSHCMVDVGFAPAGTTTIDKGRENAPRMRVMLTSTPETANTSFLFYAQIRNWGVEDIAFTDRFARDSRGIFDEDIVVMEAQQRIANSMPNARTIDIRSDAPHLAMRKLVQQALDAEQRDAKA